MEEIIAVEGIDAVFVGPSDLAVSIGVDPLRASEDSTHQALVQRVGEVCSAHRMVAGIMCAATSNALHWRKAGFRVLALQTDAKLLRWACDTVTKEVRDA